MSPIEKQSLIILIQSVEAQLGAIKKLLHSAPSSEEAPTAQRKNQVTARYTTPEEDRMIEDAMQFDKRDQLMQTVIKEAQQLDEPNGTE